MGHELWTSPITGYRRRGTRLAELRSLIDSVVSARAILEPLQSCRADASAIEASKLLRLRDYDIAGVKHRVDGPVIGWVDVQTLKQGLVEDHVESITANLLISDATPLLTVLDALKVRPYSFVLIGREVAGIVTRADLNKPPVRVYLFSLISLLEMHLGFWVRADYPDETWKKKLTPRRLAVASRTQNHRRERNQDPFLVECLQFCDKRDLVIARDRLRKRLSLGTKGDALGRFQRAENLRNVLAHSQHDLVDGTSWADVIDLTEWINAVVHTSDLEIERAAAATAAGREDDLWGSA